MNTSPTERLTWFELSALKPGAVVAFGCEYRHEICYREHVIPVGTVCTIRETGLNEIWGGLIVVPHDDAIAQSMVHAQSAHDGTIFIGDTPEPGGFDDPDGDPRWGALSPFIIHDTCPVECI